MLTLLSEPQVRMFREAGYWRDDTVYSLVRAHAAATPDKPAIRESERVVGYRELVDAADGLAAGLHRRGVRRGQRVAVWLPSRIETAVAALACSRNGYVCCPSLHRDHTVAEIIALLKRMRAAALIAQPGYGADAGRRDIFDAAAGVESLRLVVRLEPHRTVPVLPGFRPADDPPAKRDPDTVVYLAFTSGSTGQPKGVLHSDNTLLAATRAMAADWQLDQNMIAYSLSPLSHNLGWGAMVMAMTGGGEFVIHDLPRGASLVDRLADTGTTFMFGVPTHAIDLLAEMERRGLRELGAVRGFRVSGAAIPPVVARGLLDRGVTPQSGYGMTEAGSTHYTRPGDDPELIIGSSGTACAGYEVATFSPGDPDSRLPAGETGQIGGRGASLMLGYFDDQAATEDSFNGDGWFLTGDLGWVDEAGYLHLTGRMKDVIIRGGHNILPSKIEDLALRHGAVDKSAAVPVPDDRLGEKVCLALSLRPGCEVSAEEMLAHLDAAGLSRFDMPEYFLRLDAMPLLPSGKIMKRQLTEWIRQGKVTPVPVRFGSRTT